MKNMFSNDKMVERADYEAPAIIYEGLISTRAGSVILNGGGAEGADPADLFGSD